jgi:hypothetical protein
MCWDIGYTLTNISRGMYSIAGAFSGLIAVSYDSTPLCFFADSDQSMEYFIFIRTGSKAGSCWYVCLHPLQIKMLISSR